MSLKDWLTAHLQQERHADVVVSMVETLGLAEWVTADWCNGEASDGKPPTEESVKTALDRMRRLARLEPVVWDELAQEFALPYLVAASTTSENA